MQAKRSVRPGNPIVSACALRDTAKRKLPNITGFLHKKRLNSLREKNPEKKRRKKSGKSVGPKRTGKSVGEFPKKRKKS